MTALADNLSYGDTVGPLWSIFGILDSLKKTSSKLRDIGDLLFKKLSPLLIVPAIFINSKNNFFDAKLHLKIIEKWSFLNQDISKFYEANLPFFGVKTKIHALK